MRIANLSLLFVFNRIYTSACSRGPRNLRNGFKIAWPYVTWNVLIGSVLISSERQGGALICALSPAVCTASWIAMVWPLSGKDKTSYGSHGLLYPAVRKGLQPISFVSAFERHSLDLPCGIMLHCSRLGQQKAPNGRTIVIVRSYHKSHSSASNQCSCIKNGHKHRLWARSWVTLSSILIIKLELAPGFLV